MKKITKLLLMLFLSLIFVGCGNTQDNNNETTGDTSQSETLTVGFDQNFPPMGFMGEGGEFEGFDIELAKATGEKMGVEVVLQPIAWDAKDAELTSGNIDCIWNGFTMTGREEQYTFSDPYMKNRQVLVVMEDSEYQGLADFEGKKLELQMESTADNALDGAEEFKNSLGEITRVAENMTALNDLEVGSADAVLMDEVVARYNIQQGRPFRVIDEALSEEEYAVGFELGNEELRDKVNAALHELNDEGVLKELSEKYFEEDITTLGN